MPQQTSWIEKTFAEPQASFEIAIHFPQGARAIKTKGDNAGKSYRVDIYFAVEIQYQNETNWISLPGIAVGGIKKDAFTVPTLYIGGDLTQPAPPNTTIHYDQTRPFTVRVRRETMQVATNEVADELEKSRSIRYYYTSVLHSITGYSTVNKKPVTDPKGVELAKTALSILATNQVNGQIDGINAIAQTYCLDWNGTAWVKANTSNPASLFLYVLTHPGNPQQIKYVDDISEIVDKVNLEKLQYWHEYCNQTRTMVKDDTVFEYKFEYNNVLSNVRSVLEVLRDIAAAGRASPALVDGKWSVNIDEPKEVVQHFTPHNSWGFESTKALPRIPDGLKIRFFNQDKDYKQDELIVYNYGKSKADAELFESITLPGVTNSLQVEDHGKWHFAQIKLRPEIYTINTDIEYLVCNRGDLVKVTHDVPMWGLGSGRIKNRVSSNLFQLDEDVVMQAGTRYTMRVRSSTGQSTATEVIPAEYGVISYSASSGNVTIKLSTPHHFQVGDVVTISTSIPEINIANVQITQTTTDTIRYVKSAPFAPPNTAVSGTVKEPYGRTRYVQTLTALTETQANDLDLFLFGELDKESADLIVLSVEPTNGAKNARLTLVDYGVTATYNIFEDYKDLSTVTYETLITSKNPELASSLQNYTPTVNASDIVSDRRAMEEVSPGVFAYGILVPFTNTEGVPSSAEYVEAEYVRATLSGYFGTAVPQVPASSGSIIIKNIDEGVTYQIRLRYVTSTGVVGKWTSWVSHTVVGKNSPPSDVVNFQAQVVETGIKLSWDPCLDPDYAYTLIKAVDIPLQDPPEYDITTVAWNNLQRTGEIFKGPANTWTWTKPPKGMNRILAKHVDVYGNESSLLAQTVKEFKDNPIEVEDLTAPPDPTNLTAVSDYLTVILSWTPAVYDEENPIGRGHGGNIVYVAEWPLNTPQPAISQSKVAGIVSGEDHTYSFSGDPGTRYVFWVKEVSKGRGVSEGFAGPTVSTTSQNGIERLLSTLNNQIRQEHLWSVLAGRIDLIDAEGTGLVTRIADLETIYGDVISASGSAVLASGYALLASGSASLANSNAILASGSAVLSGSNAILASGSAVLSNNSSILASGSAVLAGGLATLASGSALLASNEAVSASGSAYIALTKSTDASGSAYASAFSASGSSVSAANSSGSAAAASGSAVLAETNAGFASGSAYASAFSASGAALSASDASGSAASASGSASVASTKATDASGSASGAAFSASGASTSAANASGYAASASGSAQVAAAKADSASGSAEAAAFSASGASLSEATASGYAAVASGSAAVATTKASDASGSASGAAFSASGASASEASASGYASSASGSAQVATTKADSASGSAYASAFSASGASASEVNASGYAAAASGSASVASTKASDASGSASGAAFSASGASLSEVTASGYAVVASGSAQVAATKADSASGSAYASAFSASGAAASEVNASGYAAAASGSASVASTKASDASGSASGAAFSASGASVSEANANGYASSASGSAQVAATKADSASGSAYASAFSASGASLSEVTASGYAAAASGSASVASTKATDASGSASGAAFSASGASASSASASGYASSASGSAQVAATKADSASGSADAAAFSASGASASSVSASGSAAAASGSAAVAQSNASTASGSAYAAALSASGASISASDASGSAASASGSLALATTRADSASGSAYAAALEASGAAVSASSASGSAASASGSAVIAVSKADTASGSAYAAAISASGASISESNASGSAAAASGSLELATTRANSASGSAYAAALEASGASASAVSASGSAASASGSLVLATTRADSASGSAYAASVSASGASDSASSASGSAASASGTLVLATARALDASGYAANASVSASGAAYSSVNASGYAYSAATSLTQAQALVSGTSAVVSQKMTARAASNGAALGEYSVTVDIDNKTIAGFGLAAEAGGTSTFGIRADKFYVAASGVDAIVPFKVVTTGNPTGVIIDTAFIQDASITSAKIQSLTVAQVSNAVNGNTASGGRVEITATNGGRIRVYDTNGTVARVKIGNLG